MITSPSTAIARLLALSVAASAGASSAQTWNSNAGGWNTGYGTVYGSFGYAMATQNMYNTMQMNMQRSMMRAAMVKKWGEAAVAKAEREAKAGRAPSESGPQVSAPPPPPKGTGRFKTDRSVDVGRLLAENLGGTKEEKQLVGQVFAATKQAFENEPDTKPMRNNVAGALAFFIIGNATIYRDAPEPSDEASLAIFRAVEQAVEASPELAKLANKEKQALYDLLIGFTGLPLAIYADAKERGDAAQLAQARELAGKLIELVLKVDPAKVDLGGS